MHRDTIAQDAYPVYREEDCEFLAYTDEDGCRARAEDATHYLANDPNMQTHMFALAR